MRSFLIQIERTQFYVFNQIMIVSISRVLGCLNVGKAHRRILGFVFSVIFLRSRSSLCRLSLISLFICLRRGFSSMFQILLRLWASQCHRFKYIYCIFKLSLSYYILQIAQLNMYFKCKILVSKKKKHCLFRIWENSFLIFYPYIHS